MPDRFPQRPDRAIRDWVAYLAFAFLAGVVVYAVLAALGLVPA
ncbi:hypothetical protein [Enemella dayhoffiae]|nr:hypothetical protein [Enemella dayhoffiae]